MYLNRKSQLLASILVSFNNFVDFPLCSQLFFGVHFLQIYNQFSKVVSISNSETAIVIVIMEIAEISSYITYKRNLS